MSEPVVTHLNDHLGGAQIAVQVLEAMRDQHDDPKFREFANSLLPEIEADDRILRSIAEKIGSGPNVVNKRAGWLLEKFARLKLGNTGSTNFEMFESLELQLINIKLPRKPFPYSVEQRIDPYPNGEVADYCRLSTLCASFPDSS
jgi:hypothetical protein